MEKERILFGEKELSVNLCTLSMEPQGVYRGDHLHNAAELVLCEGGDMLCCIEGEDITVRRGEMILINTRAIHRLIPISPLNCRYMQIDIERYRREEKEESSTLAYLLMPQGMTRSYLLFPQGSILHSIFQGIWQEISQKKTAYPLAVRGEICRLVALMYREGLLFDPTLARFPAGYERILPALQYIEEHYQSKITLSDIAELLQCDKYHFCKQFKRITGMTFVDHINDRRLRAAEELLLTTNDSIADIAFACGFNSIQYFNKFFRNRRKISPGAYRSKKI